MTAGKLWIRNADAVVWDPVAALLFCGPFAVRDPVVEGREVVRGGMLTTLDPVALAETARARAARLAS